MRGWREPGRRQGLSTGLAAVLIGAASLLLIAAVEEAERSSVAVLPAQLPAHP